MRGQARQPMRRRWRAAGVPIALLLGGLAADDGRAAIELLDPLTNEPLALDKRPDQTTTPAAGEFGRRATAPVCHSHGRLGFTTCADLDSPFEVALGHHLW